MDLFNLNNQYVKVIRKGGKSTRVQLVDGTSVLVNNEELKNWKYLGAPAEESVKSTKEKVISKPRRSPGYIGDKHPFEELGLAPDFKREMVAFFPGVEQPF